MVDIREIVDRMIAEGKDNIPFRTIRILNLLKGRRSHEYARAF